MFERAAETDLVQEIGVVGFAGRGGAGDMSPAAGVQLLTTLDADENGNGLPDYEDVIRSARINSGLRTFSFSSSGAGTAYSGGAQAACTVAAQVSTENPLVVFLSDGDNLRGSDVTSVLPCSTPTEFQTVAVGTGSSCTQNARLQQDIADLRAQGATDFRVDQQQVNIDGERVGVNRPDLQFTLDGERYYYEYDTSSSNRGPGHRDRILANDPDGNVELFTVD